MKVPAHVAQFYLDFLAASRERKSEAHLHPVKIYRLPADSVDALLKKWDQAAARYRTGGEISKTVADVFDLCAADLRAELERTAGGADLNSARTVEANFGTAMPFKESDLSPAPTEPQP